MNDDQIRLTASAVSNLSVAIFVAGPIYGLAQILFGDAPQIKGYVMLNWVAGALALHLVALKILEDVSE